MIHCVNNIAKIIKTYVHRKSKQIIDKPKDVWAAPQMTQLFLLLGHPHVWGCSFVLVWFHQYYFYYYYSYYSYYFS